MLKQAEIKEKLVAVAAEGNEAVKGFELTGKQAEFLIKAIDAIREQDLLETGKVKLPGVGTLEIRYRKERQGRNPKTNEPIAIPETLTVALSTSSFIKEKIAEQVDIEQYRK